MSTDTPLNAPQQEAITDATARGRRSARKEPRVTPLSYRRATLRAVLPASPLPGQPEKLGVAFSLDVGFFTERFVLPLNEALDLSRLIVAAAEAGTRKGASQEGALGVGVEGPQSCGSGPKFAGQASEAVSAAADDKPQYERADAAAAQGRAAQEAHQ